MKRFNEYLAEDFDPAIYNHDGGISIDDPTVVDAINSNLEVTTANVFRTPYNALEDVRKVLEYYKIFLPKAIFLDQNHGNDVFEISQFGEKMGMNDQGEVVTASDSPLFVYFEWSLNDEGMFDVFASVVNEDELNEIMADFDAEVEDDETDLTEERSMGGVSKMLYKLVNRMKSEKQSDDVDDYIEHEKQGKTFTQMNEEPMPDLKKKMGAKKVTLSNMMKEAWYHTEPLEDGKHKIVSIVNKQNPYKHEPGDVITSGEHSLRQYTSDGSAYGSAPAPTPAKKTAKKTPSVKPKKITEMKSSNPKGIAQKITIASHAQNPSWGPANLNPDMSKDFGAKATRSSASAAIKAFRELRKKHGSVDINNPEHIEHISKAIHGSPSDFGGKPKGWSKAAIELGEPYQNTEKKERRAKLTGPYDSLSNDEKEKDRQIARVVVQRYTKEENEPFVPPFVQKGKEKVNPNRRASTISAKAKKQTKKMIRKKK